jgi:flavoprotein
MSLAVNKRKIVVAITGASGAVYALSLMKRLRELPEAPSEVAVILTVNAEEIMLYETSMGMVDRITHGVSDDLINEAGSHTLPWLISIFG